MTDILEIILTAVIIIIICFACAAVIWTLGIFGNAGKKFADWKVKRAERRKLEAQTELVHSANRFKRFQNASNKSSSSEVELFL